MEKPSKACHKTVYSLSMSRLNSKREVHATQEEVVKSGIWLYYKNETTCETKLAKQVCKHNNLDLYGLNKIIEIPFNNSIDFNISNEGVIYSCKLVIPTVKKTATSLWIFGFYWRR